jgi:hypothetical protein
VAEDLINLRVESERGHQPETERYYRQALTSFKAFMARNIPRPPIS